MQYLFERPSFLFVTRQTRSQSLLTNLLTKEKLYHDEGSPGAMRSRQVLPRSDWERVW